MTETYPTASITSFPSLLFSATVLSLCSSTHLLALGDDLGRMSGCERRVLRAVYPVWYVKSKETIAIALVERTRKWPITCKYKMKSSTSAISSHISHLHMRGLIALYKSSGSSTTITMLADDEDQGGDTKGESCKVLPNKIISHCPVPRQPSISPPAANDKLPRDDSMLPTMSNDASANTEKKKEKRESVKR